jgi:hypothetical protein
MVVIYQSINDKLQRRQLEMVGRYTRLQDMVLYFSLEVFDTIVLLSTEKPSAPWIGVDSVKNSLFLWDSHKVIEVFETAYKGAISQQHN